jgi:hypothetical protein
MKTLFKVLGLCFMLSLYLGIVAPLADAWCVYNYTDIPLRIWSGPGETDTKFYVDHGNFSCCTEKYQSGDKHDKKHHKTKKLVGPCTGPAYVTFTEAYTYSPSGEPFYEVADQVPANGIVIIKGQKPVGLTWTYEVYDENEANKLTGNIKATPPGSPYYTPK